MTVDPDETAYYEPSHLDLQCLQIQLLKCLALYGLTCDFLSDPMKESSTIYDVFAAKEQEKRQEKFVDKLDSKDASGKGMADGSQRKKAPVKNGKKPEQANKKQTFEEAAKEVCSFLQGFLLVRHKPGC